jgi:protein TonB
MHVLALALGLAMKGPKPDVAPDATPIRVEIITEVRSKAVRTDLSVRLLDPAMPQPIPPVVLPALPEEPPVSAITVAPSPPAETQVVEQRVPASEGPITVTDPDYLQMPQPVYPAAAKRARAQGLVHVRALVDEEGRPAEVSIAQSSGFELLDGAACSAVRRARFKPYRRDNVARSMVVIVPIEFSIRSRS